MPLDVVVEFKRGVYELALTELARFLPRPEQRNRYLRGGLRGHERANAPVGADVPASRPATLELPPGASLVGGLRTPLGPRGEP